MLADVSELGQSNSPLLVCHPGRVTMQVIAEHRIDIADKVRLHPAIRKFYSFFISPCLVSNISIAIGIAP